MKIAKRKKKISNRQGAVSNSLKLTTLLSTNQEDFCHPSKCQMQ